MNVHDAAEQAYRNGYAKGYADAKKNEKHGRWKDGVCTACCFDIRYMIDGESEFYNWVWNGLNYCPECGAIMDLPNITENTRKALEKMGENVHSEIDFDYAAEDEL